MSNSKIDLVTKYGDKITGVKLLNGSIGTISHTVDIKTRHIDCLLPEGIAELPDGTYTFILQSGEEFREKLSVILDVSLDRWMGI